MENESEGNPGDNDHSDTTGEIQQPHGGESDGSTPSSSLTKTATGELIQAASQDPNARAAGSEIGKTAHTLTKTVNNVLLPLAYVNYGFDKAREYFSNRFSDDIAEKTQDIPQERLVPPKASVAGPALQGLAFSHDETELREMYLNLLRAAMDSETADEAHPAFVRIIEQLSASEAQILDKVLTTPGDTVPVAAIKRDDQQEGGYNILYRHLFNLHEDTTGEPVENAKLPVMADNWIRLGLVTIDYGKWLTQSEAYDWVDKRPEFVRLKAENQSERYSVTYSCGVLEVTNLGKQFAKAVGATSPHPDP